MQRRTLTFANIVQRVYPVRRAWMVTLTYREDGQWRPEHVADLVRSMRKWCQRQGTDFVYEWVAEVTKRGRPHYHLVVWLPRRLSCPKVDKAGWWPHGMSQREQARFAPGYLAKYVSKGVDQWGDDGDVKRLPRGARMHGSGGLRGAPQVELRWWMLPRWMRESVKWMGEARRIKGGWLCTQTGEFFPTPFEVMFSKGVCWFRRKCEESSPSPRSPRESAGTTPFLSVT